MATHLPLLTLWAWESQSVLGTLVTHFQISNYLTRAKPDGGIPRNYIGDVRPHELWSGRVMKHWEQTTRKILRGAVQYESNPNACIYSSAVYTTLCCTAWLVWCTKKDSLLQIRKQEYQGLKMLNHHLKWPIFRAVWFLFYSFFKRADQKEKFQRICRKGTV